MIIKEFKIDQKDIIISGLKQSIFSPWDIYLFQDKDPDVDGIIFDDAEYGHLCLSIDKLDDMISILNEIKTIYKP